MVSLKIQEWLAPDVKKERDIALLKVHDLTQQLSKAVTDALDLTFRLQTAETALQLMREQKTDPTRPLRAATAADVRRLTERAFASEETSQNGI